jgi:hypothetical protein
MNAMRTKFLGVTALIIAAGYPTACSSAAMNNSSIVGTWSESINGSFCCTVVYEASDGSSNQGTSSASNNGTQLNAGTWTSSGDTITATWVSTVDTLTLSSDGNSFSGSNNDGAIITGERTGS